MRASLENLFDGVNYFGSRRTPILVIRRRIENAELALAGLYDGYSVCSLGQRTTEFARNKLRVRQRLIISH